MKNGNVVEFRHFQALRKEREALMKPSVSRELEKAIKNLIKRLRENGPLKRSG